LTYFRNNILHLFVLPSLVACLMQHNGQLHREQISQVIVSLYPYLKSELFLSWDVNEIEALVNQHIDILISSGILTIVDHVIFSPHPNTEEYAQLVILGEAVKETLERYFMTISLLTERQSGSINQKQLENLCSLLAQRLSVLYEFNSPEFFDKGIFRNFIDTLKKVGLLQQDEQGLLHFDSRLYEIATQANLVLREETQHTIQQITNVSDEDINSAMAELERKEKKRK
ncbi:MAG TPA: glycerol-3-phosphate 1-O-acyltransferase PlsB, partial [Agitococcus sp.]|nr:glycerol-3-phosphate 1-O-acyltransferase PlsB [Agitococcus sp.]